MSLLQEAIEFVDSWGEGYEFWALVHWTAEQPRGHVIIRPDFIGLAEEHGDTINVWLAMGEDGVTKAIELAPPTVTKAAWMRAARNKNDKPRTWDIDRIRRKTNERSIRKQEIGCTSSPGSITDDANCRHRGRDGSRLTRREADARQAQGSA